MLFKRMKKAAENAEAAILIKTAAWKRKGCIALKNTLTDLNNYLFEMIERLNDDDLTDEELEREIRRGDAVQKVAKTIIDNGALALQAKKHFDEYGMNRDVELPLLGITSRELENENKALRERVKKLEKW